MAFRIRYRCYVCDREGIPRQMPYLGEDENKQQIALNRRNDNDLENINIDANTRICANCNRSILDEIAAIEADPTCLRLNVLNQRGNRVCIICGAENNIERITLACRVNAFIQGNIYIPENVRLCAHHLNTNGLIISQFILGLDFTNKPYVICGAQLQVFLQELRNVASTRPRLDDFDNLTDEEFQCLFSLNKEQFEDLFTFCDLVNDGHASRNIHKKDLMAFLCKVRQGLSDEFLRVLFNYSTRQTVSMAINITMRSLTARFVPEFIGVQAIDRQDFIQQHVTPFANELYNEEPGTPKVIVICDATYAYIHKSTNFRVLRQSYSMHKGRHLLKPTLIVAPDGYILTIFGPYFSDYRNNDAAILRNEFERDAQTLRNWFQNGDIFLVDRGYRDIRPFLQQLGINYKMPALLERGERQLSTESANNSRLVTKSRWIVEARNGHFRTMFKIFEHVFNIQNAKKIGDYYRIAEAIINKYHPVINMQGATVELARDILQRARNANVVQARVQIDDLRIRRAQWQRLHNQIPDFPRLSLEYLRDLTIGVYQVNLSSSYIQDKQQRDGDDELQIDILLNERNMIRVGVFSRFRDRMKHQVFITYITEENFTDEDDHNPISGYYCTCQSGARTVGTCAHVASILWYLGYSRHEQNVKYPDESLLNTTMDAAHRADQNIGVEIIEV